MERPDPEELAEWAATAAKRKAILPFQFRMKIPYIHIVCGHCQEDFTRKLLPQRNDPVYVCPNCSSRNYVPIQW